MTESILERAMIVQTQEEADLLFAEYVQEMREHVSFAEYSKKEGKPAEDLARRNLGYYAGYFSAETRERVERLFQCEHPFLGAIAKTGILPIDEIFKIGYNEGVKLRLKEEQAMSDATKTKGMSVQDCQALMAGSATNAEWEKNVARVKESWGGKLPDFWNTIITESQLQTWRQKQKKKR